MAKPVTDKRDTKAKSNGRHLTADKVTVTTDGVEYEIPVEEQPSRQVGRPTSYRPEYAEQAKRLWEVGFTDLEVADFFGVAEKTIYNWQASNPEFLQAAILGKHSPDDRMARALYHRGLGYEWIEQQHVKCKEVAYEDGKRVERERVEVVDVRRRVPPDTQAMTFWLRNRRRDLWPDSSKSEITGPDGGPIKVETQIEPLERGRRIAFLLTQAAQLQIEDKSE